RQVRPFLSGRCFQCHGPDEASRQAELRLDQPDSATAELASGARALVPGDAAASAELERVTSSDPDLVMPPPSIGKPLSEAEVAGLGQWIAEGATHTQHWAYGAAARPALPDVSRAKWTKNPIDYFVLARLDREGIAPAPEADRPALLRRASLDLTGLPPSV